MIPISQKKNCSLLRIPKGTSNYTTISGRVWNEIVSKIIHFKI